MDPFSQVIYVADKGNHRIRKIDLSTGFMSTVVGNGACGTCDSSDPRKQTLDAPYDLQFCPPHHLIICGSDNSIRKFDLEMRTLVTILVGS